MKYEVTTKLHQGLTPIGLLVYPDEWMKVDEVAAALLIAVHGQSVSGPFGERTRLTREEARHTFLWNVRRLGDIPTINLWYADYVKGACIKMGCSLLPGSLSIMTNPFSSEEAARDCFVRTERILAGWSGYRSEIAKMIDADPDLPNFDWENSWGSIQTLVPLLLPKHPEFALGLLFEGMDKWNMGNRTLAEQALLLRSRGQRIEQFMQGFSGDPTLERVPEAASPT